MCLSLYMFLMIKLKCLTFSNCLFCLVMEQKIQEDQKSEQQADTRIRKAQVCLLFPGNLMRSFTHPDVRLIFGILLFVPLS